MTSFDRQFDFHDVIYRPRNIENRQCNVDSQLLDFQKVKLHVSVQTKSCGIFYLSVLDDGIVIDSERFVHIFNLFVC